MGAGSTIGILAAMLVSLQLCLGQADTAKIALTLDTLVNLKHKYDSLFAGADQRIDSATGAFNKGLDRLTRSFNNRIDSLNGLSISDQYYADSLRGIFSSFKSRFASLQPSLNDSLGLEAKEKIRHMDEVIANKTKRLDSLLALNGVTGIRDKIRTDKIMDIKLPDSGGFPKLFQGNSIQFSPNLPDVKVTLPVTGIDPNLKGLPQLDKSKLPGGDLMKAVEDLQKAKDLAPDLKNPNVLDKVGSEFGDKGIGADALKTVEGIKEIKEAAPDLKNANLLDKAGTVIENNAMGVGELKELKKNTEVVDKTKKELERIKELEKMEDLQNQEELRKKAKEQFVDHLAGKEALVKKDMENIGKLQLKYRNVADSRLLPKRPPNEMKGKPFIERLIPAVTFQMFIGNSVSADVAPSLGYRFTGRYRAGLGGYRRITFDKSNKTISDNRIFGVRVYNQFRFIGTNYVHVEFEHFEGPATTNPYAERPQGFINKINFGIYRTFSLGKRFQGHTLLLYDLYQLKNFPNTSHSALRFGFDYQLRKKKETNSK